METITPSILAAELTAAAPALSETEHILRAAFIGYWPKATRSMPRPSPAAPTCPPTW
jgi:hypothetical protein